jgi:hypothetical protein
MLPRISVHSSLTPSSHCALLSLGANQVLFKDQINYISLICLRGQFLSSLIINSFFVFPFPGTHPVVASLPAPLPFVRLAHIPATLVKAHSSRTTPVSSLGEATSTSEKTVTFLNGMTPSDVMHESPSTSDTSDEDEHFPLVHRHHCRVKNCKYQCWMDRNFQLHQGSHDTD